jgi:hypothetical protein
MRPAEALAGTNGTIEICQSRAQMAWGAVAAAIVTVMSGVVARHPDPGFGVVTIAFGVAGVVFFGMCTALLIWRLLTTRVVLTLAPEGIRDVRLAREFIPWSAIEGVSIYTMAGQRCVVLKVAPEVERRLTLTRIARWTRGGNRALGADGLCISAQGLEIELDALLVLIAARLPGSALPE